MNQDRPHIDEDEQADISNLLQREDEWEDVVWDGLREAVKWVESMRRERRRHNPLVVRLMQRLINSRMMQTPMNQVDEEIRKEQEERKLEPLVPCPWSVGGHVVELGVSALFEEKTDGG